MPTLLTLALGLTLLAGMPAVAADSDGDGLRDFFENKWGVTDPAKADTDGDGVVDSAEDSDGDRLSDRGEQRWFTNPGDKDSDGDGRNDGNEDRNGNGINNALEQDKRPLPKGMKPTLANAKSSYPAARDKCFSRIGQSYAKRCFFGDLESDTTIALFGDSHALQWVPPFTRAAKQGGWKLVTLLKGGCPSVKAGNIGQWRIDRLKTCNRWRENAFAWLRNNPPDLIVITNSDNYKLINARGKVIRDMTKRMKRWRYGLNKTFDALPAASDVLIFGETPANDGDPIKCLVSHRRNMSACQARRLPLRKRKLEVVERDVAAERDAQFRTLYDKICSYDPCPLVQGKVLMWRDAGHMTNKFAKLLTPSVRATLADTLAAASTSTTSD